MKLIDLAKSLISHEKELIGKIENAVLPAQEELFALIGNKEFCRYKNYPETGIPIISIKDSGEPSKSIVEISPEYIIQKFDVSEITETINYNGFYEISEYGTNTGLFIIRKPFTINETGFINLMPISRYKMANAWLICYYSTFTIQELKKDKVLINSEQFGEGDVSSYLQSQIKILRDEYLRNAHLLIGKQGIREK